jgi:hypothetical protein
MGMAIHKNDEEDKKISRQISSMDFKERTSHFQTTDIDPHSGGLLAEPCHVRGKVKAILRDSFCGFLKARNHTMGSQLIYRICLGTLNWRVSGDRHRLSFLLLKPMMVSDN